MNYHLLREFPPGYGGIERVAHSIAQELGGDVFFLRSGKKYNDPLYVNYRRKYIRSFILGRFYIPIPCKTLFEVLFTSSIFINLGFSFGTVPNIYSCNSSDISSFRTFH